MANSNGTLVTRIATLGALAASLLAGPLAAATRTVYVGRGGNKFVDDASGTAVTTIQIGDTVTWVWEDAAMMHSVTSGTCTSGGGGYYGGGGDTCDDSRLWTSTGLQAAGFRFSHTFTTEGTFKYYCARHESAMTGKVVVQPASAPAPCDDRSAERLCLNGGRFEVSAEWTKPDTTSGHGTGVKLTDDAGYFWFFSADNIEVTIKVLDACSFTTDHWVFAAGLTNVGVEIKVRDTQSGVEYRKENPVGTAFAPIQDPKAFPSSCP